MDLTPKQIVYKLDKYIIGQDDAKKAVAIALRNRYRRAQLPVEVREEITPKNIIILPQSPSMGTLSTSTSGSPKSLPISFISATVRFEQGEKSPAASP